jgi:hypothetical protein
MLSNILLLLIVIEAQMLAPGLGREHAMRIRDPIDLCFAPRIAHADRRNGDQDLDQIAHQRRQSLGAKGEERRDGEGGDCRALIPRGAHPIPHICYTRTRNQEGGRVNMSGLS